VANLPQADKGKARDHAAGTVKVSGRSVEHATKVLKNGNSKLVKAVDSGQLPVSAASKIAEFPKSEQSKILKELAKPSKRKKSTRSHNLTVDEKRERDNWTEFAKASVGLDEAIGLLAQPGYDLNELIQKCAAPTLKRIHSNIDRAIMNSKTIKREVCKCLRR
jgi:hypothetical protein